MLNSYDAIIISFLLAFLLNEISKVIADVFPMVEYDPSIWGGDGLDPRPGPVFPDPAPEFIGDD